LEQLLFYQLSSQHIPCVNNNSRKNSDEVIKSLLRESYLNFGNTNDAYKKPSFDSSRQMSSKITFYGGVHEIGENKFLVQDKNTTIFLDFGMQMGKSESVFCRIFEASNI
jgi:predicted metal-dependent RNase